MDHYRPSRNISDISSLLTVFPQIRRVSGRDSSGSSALPRSFLRFKLPSPVVRPIRILDPLSKVSGPFKSQNCRWTSGRTLLSGGLRRILMKEFLYLFRKTSLKTKDIEWTSGNDFGFRFFFLILFGAFLMSRYILLLYFTLRIFI